MRGAVDGVEVHGRLPARQPRAEPGVDLERLVRDGPDEVGPPVPLVAPGVDAVERGLQHRVRHGGDAVEQRRGCGCQQRHEDGRGGALVLAHVASDDAADLLQVQLRRERRCGQHRPDEEERVEVLRRGGQEVAVDRQHLGGLLDGPEDRAGHDGAHLVQAEGEPGDDAEVPAAAAHGPEQVGVLGRARGDLTAVREDHVDGEQVVDRQAEPAGEVAQATAEGEPADPRGRDDAARCREAVGVGGAVDLSPGGPAADGGGAGVAVDVDVDVAQAPQVDDHAVVDRAQAGAVVAAAAYGQRRVVVAGEADRPGCLWMKAL